MESRGNIYNGVKTSCQGNIFFENQQLRDKRLLKQKADSFQKSIYTQFTMFSSVSLDLIVNPANYVISTSSKLLNNVDRNIVHHIVSDKSSTTKVSEEHADQQNIAEVCWKKERYTSNNRECI